MHECKTDHASHAIWLREAGRPTLHKPLQPLAPELFTL
jgi:hypothetical protein